MFIIIKNYITCHFNILKKCVAETPSAISQEIFQSWSKVSQVLAALFLLGSLRFLPCLFEALNSCGHFTFKVLPNEVEANKSGERAGHCTSPFRLTCCGNIPRSTFFDASLYNIRTAMLELYCTEMNSRRN